MERASFFSFLFFLDGEKYMSKKEIYMRKLKILLVMLNDNSGKLHLIYRQFTK